MPETTQNAPAGAEQHPARPPNFIEEQPNLTPTFYGIGILVAAIVLSGMWLVGRYSDMDYSRDVQTWREKLNLIVESRDTGVEQWISGNFDELRTLADNPSLRMYVTELEIRNASKSARKAPEASQKSYLRNLMLYTAQRAGFTSSKSAKIDANVASVKGAGEGGIALLDNNNAIIVSSVVSPYTKSLLIEHAKKAVKAEESLIDLQKSKSGDPYIGFMMPIYGIQSERNAKGQIGVIVAIKSAKNSGLYERLKHPGVIESSLETVLLRKNNDVVEYISPLLGSEDILERTEKVDSQNKNIAALVGSSSGFAAGLPDYSGKAVLATSRQVNGTPWTIVTKIQQQEALAQSAQRRASMQMILFLLVAVIALIVAATWWRVSSKRSLMMSEYFQRSAERARAQEQLLRLVADHQPEPIYIVDQKDTVHFANQQAARKAKMAVEMIAGHSLFDVRGGARATQLSERCAEVLGKGTIAYEIERQGDDRDTQNVYRNAYVPLKHIPLAHLPKPTAGVLIVEQNITEVVRERELRMRTNRQLIETLVALVDKRDPFSAHHSMLVSQLAYEVAVQMELDTPSVETASKAGMLMNIGKIIVPAELLTKTTPLTFDEKHMVHQSMNMAAELMDGISFDGPVAETLRQWQEKWDGTGPLGLAEGDILLTARIIACANAFIGMVSPRAWRTAMSIEAASKFMMDECDTHFDRRVVIAMLSFMDNQEGKVWLDKVIENNQDAA